MTDSQVPVVPVRTLVLTFVLAAFALVGITMVAIGQLQRPRPLVPRALPVPIVVAAPPAPAIVARAPEEPGRTPVVARRKRDKPAATAPEVRRPGVVCSNNDPLCGLTIE